jgi:hypothetical protein
MAFERPEIGRPEGDIPFELAIEDIVVGDGEEATSGKKVSVHYVGVAFSTARSSTRPGTAALRSSSSSARGR